MSVKSYEKPYDRPIFYAGCEYKALVMFTSSDSFRIRPPSELVYSTKLDKWPIEALRPTAGKFSIMD